MEKSRQIDGNGLYSAVPAYDYQGPPWARTALQARSARSATALQPQSEDRTRMETPKTVQDLLNRLVTQEADLFMKASEHQDRARELRAEAVSLSQRRDDIEFVIDAFSATTPIPDSKQSASQEFVSNERAYQDWAEASEADASEAPPQPPTKRKSRSDVVLEALREKADTVVGLKRRTGFNSISPYLTIMKRCGLVFHDVRNQIWSAVPPTPLGKKDRILTYLSNHKPSRLRSIADGVGLSASTISNPLYELQKAGKVSLDRQTHLWSLV